jgi:BirA family biotin operon repressor/biotin-[acetyl-CoA-carboxylase] ligase
LSHGDVIIARVTRPAHTTKAEGRAKDLRRRLTVSEARVWGAMKNKALGARFRRQVPIGPWIVDFCSLDPKLAIEIDDKSLEFRDESLRTEYLESVGFPVLRFTNRQVALEFPGVIGTIESWVAHMKATGKPPRN